MDNKCFESLMMGQDIEVPLISGKHIKYVNLDNAASTPPFKKVLDKVNEFSEVYSSVYRWNGLKSYISTEAYHEAREIVGRFVGADMDNNSMIIDRLLYALDNITKGKYSKEYVLDKKMEAIHL